ncbi:MAG: DedA family protein [Epsilonproteobacteria bacterium]|nr:DedA family protein [Campylobacterota bacterium]
MAEFSLFISAFLAATILPFSSELALLGAISSGMGKLDAVLFASFGNILAIALNYLLGFFLYEKTHKKLNISKFGRKSLKLGHNYGYYALLLSWLPLIGDPLTLVAGVVRLNFIKFIIIAGILRIIRYYILTLML